MAPVEIARYLHHIKLAEEELGINISDFDEVASTQVEKDSFNWLMFILILIVLTFSIIASFKIYTYQLGSPLNRSEDLNLQGIKGWLFLVGLVVVVAPFRCGIDLCGELGSVLSNNAWLSVSSPNIEGFQAILAPIVLFEMIVAIIQFAFFVLVLVLFLKKKRIFPLVFLSVMIANFLFLAFDGAVSILALSQSLTRQERIEIIRLALHTLIMTFYLLKSKRVKETFVE